MKKGHSIFPTSLFCLLMMSGWAYGQNTTIHLVKQWQTDTTIRTPESVLWDNTGQFFFVSDINGNGSAKDGNGFISKIGPDGKIIKLHWVDGLDAPKGMGMYDGKLFVADLAQLVIINIAKAKIIKKMVLPGASFLNDIYADARGNVYISDSHFGRVYRYYKGNVSVYLDDPKLAGANGLLEWHHLLWINGSKGIFQYNPADKSLKLFTDAVKSCDGITILDDNDLITSRWQGEVYEVKADGTATKLVDVKAEHKNTADLYYLASRHLLVVPTFNGNVIMGYKVTD